MDYTKELMKAMDHSDLKALELLDKILSPHIEDEFHTTHYPNMDIMEQLGSKYAIQYSRVCQYRRDRALAHKEGREWKFIQIPKVKPIL